MNEWTVKNVKRFEGMEGPGFNCSLYLNGKRVALVIDDANGGPFMFQWLGKRGQVGLVNEMAFEQTIKEEPSYTYQGTVMEMTADVFVHELVLLYEEEKILKRYCKTRVLYKVPGRNYELGEWNSITQPFTHLVVHKLTQKYGSDLEIHNFKYGQPK